MDLSHLTSKFKDLADSAVVNGLKNDIADIIHEEVSGLIKGATDDLKTFGNQIADDIIRVTAIKDEGRRMRLLNELVMQVRLIGEIHRLEANQAAWETAGKIVAVVAKMAIKFLVPLP